jgi:hypothetical protein
LVCGGTQKFIGIGPCCANQVEVQASLDIPLAYSENHADTRNMGTVRLNIFSQAFTLYKRSVQERVEPHSQRA